MTDYPKTIDYKKDMEIDMDNLHIECVAHARMTTDYTDLLAQAILDRDKAKEALEVNEAQLDQAIREAAANRIGPDGKVNPEKVTEAVVKNRMVLDLSHQQAVNRLIEAEYVVNVLKGAVKGCDKKGDRLKDLKEFYLNKYYAESYGLMDAEGKFGPQSLDHGRLAATEAMRKTIGPVAGALLPEVKEILPTPSCRPPTPGPAPSRDKDGHRYAIGLISEDGKHAFIAGPWPELQQALDWSGEFGQAIYRLTREQPDEMIYIWNKTGQKWIENRWPDDSKPEPPKTLLPPRPPQRPLPKRP